MSDVVVARFPTYAPLRPAAATDGMRSPKFWEPELVGLARVGGLEGVRNPVNL